MPKPPRPSLHGQIREARLAANMTQAELAKAMSVSQRFVFALESGDRTPNVHHLIAVCKATGCEFPIDKDIVVFVEE